jgi:glycosyltransferase involved in cell wall biosynthesis
VVTGPVVTVVTPTFRRPRTILERAIPGIESQTYENIEHIIVIDGHDPDTLSVLFGAGYGWDNPARRVTYLSRNWTSYSGDGGLGNAARNTGMWMAAGDYIAHLDDDITWMPHHLETLVGLIESSGVDFVTSSWLFQGHHGGGTPPGPGQTDVSGIVHRPMVLKTGGGFTHDGETGEGLMVQRWMAAGCTWAHHGEPTFIMHSSRHGAPDD